MKTYEVIKELIEAGQGRVPCDLKLQNVQLVNVFSSEIYKTDIYLNNDILKLTIVERYGKTGGVGIGFLKGFHLKKGAMAFSTSHAHHNIVVVGVNDADMAVAVNAIHEMQGEVSAASDGVVTGQMSLPIGGLMSEKNSVEVAKELEKANQAALDLGCDVQAPFMALSFISLPTVPELGLTDLGLIDVLNHCLIDVEVLEQ